MDDLELSVSVPLDEDGYLVFQCPHCEDRYKLLPAEFEEDDVINVFCPYCGLQAELNESFTPEVVAAIQQIAMNRVSQLFEDAMREVARSSKGTMDVQVQSDEKDAPELIESDKQLHVHVFDCCGRSAKLRAVDSMSIVYCPYDGVI